MSQKQDDKLRILFLHFPTDNDQIESRTLPDYFALNGHTAYSLFEKNDRNFYSKHTGVKLPLIKLQKKEISNQTFDLIVCKSDSYQKYGQSFKTKNTKVINVTPMGLSRNSHGVDYSFPENWLIKPPTEEMRSIYKHNYIPYSERENSILIPGTVSQIKNQKQIIDLLDKNILGGDFYLHFAGKIRDRRYAEILKLACAEKNIRCVFGEYTKEQLAFHYLNSKLVCLSSDPRPAQPFDPGPRVIFEALCAGTPCVVSDLVLIHQHSHMFCNVYESYNKESFAINIKEMMARDLVGLSRLYYESYGELFSMENACKTAYKEILSCYQKLNN